MGYADFFNQSTPSGVAFDNKPTPSGGLRRGSAAQLPAANSQQRGFPERVDINDFVQGNNYGAQKLSDQIAGGSLQALEIAGKAPGFALERPLAIADTLAQQTTGRSPLAGVESGIGRVPVLGAALGGIGDVLHNISTLPAAIANSSEADSLRRGTVENWADNTILQQDNLFGGPSGTTWGEFKAEAARKGWRGQDIQDMIDGKKSTFDFGDHRMSADNLAEMGLRIGSDPTNLLFGLGATLKLAKGVGLLGQAVKVGAELEKPLAPALAGEAVARGIGQQSTWMGMAHYFGIVGRGIGFVPGGEAAVAAGARAGSYAGKLGRAYRNVAVGATAGQVGIGLADRVLNGDGSNSPHSGFLEPLFQLNRAAFDNQPFSNEVAFSLWSAFHFPIHEYLGNVKKLATAGKRAAVGNSVYADVVKALGDGWNGTPAQVVERAGGVDNIWNLIGHTHAHIVFAKIMRNPVVKAAISHYGSLDEAVATNDRVAGLVRTSLEDAYTKGEITGKMTVQQLKEWHAWRAVEVPGQAAKRLNEVAIPWHGGQAIDRWHEYGAAVAPVADIYRQRGDIVLGLRDALIGLDLEHMGMAVKISAGPDKMVPLAEVRKWLSKYPQLLADDPGWNQYLVDSAPSRVPMGPILGKLKRAAKVTPSARELTHEAGVAETAASKDAIANPIDAQTIRDRVDQGSATIGVSRMRPAIAKRLGLAPTTLSDVQRARLAPEIETFERNLGPALQAQGFNFSDISQGFSSHGGQIEPVVEIATNARLPEMRLLAATLGRLTDADAIPLSITGRRMRELGLNPNAFEAVAQLPSTSPAMLEQVSRAASRAFPDYTLNDATGTLRMVLDAYTPETQATLSRLLAEIEGFFSKDQIGDAGIKTSLHAAYVEYITKGKPYGAGATYGDVLRSARAAGDPRADAHTAIRKSVAYSGAGPRNARPDVGPGAAVGREPGAGGLAPGGLALATPAERVGLGDLAALPPDQPGYLYHVTKNIETAQEIARDKLRPFSPDGSVWADGGTGKRLYFGRDSQTALGQAPGMAIFRVKESRAGSRIKADSYGNGNVYTDRPISSANLEVFGGDGQWHPARGFFEPEVEPQIREAAAQAAPAYQAVPPGTSQSYLDQAMAQQSLGGEPGYIYHSTKSSNLPSILTAGVVPKGGVSYWSGQSAGIGHTVFGDLLLRQKAGPSLEAVHGNPELGGVHRGAVPASDLEYWGSDGDWHPLDELRSTPDVLTAGLRAIEDEGAAALGQGGTEAGMLSELATMGDTLSPESVARAQELNTQIERQRLAKGEVRQGAVLANAKLDAEAGQYAPLHHMLSEETGVQRAELEATDQLLQQHWPAYQVKRAPEANIFNVQGGEMAKRYLGERTKLGDALANWGPTSRISRFVDALTSPLTNRSLGIAAEQELMNQLLPKGAKPAEVRAFIKKLNQEASLHTFGPARHRVRAFRNPTALGAQAINKIAAGDVEAGKVPMFSQATIDAVGRDGFARVLDRASNRFIREMDRTALRGGQKGSLARAIGNSYGAWQKSMPGDVTRYVSKTMYNWFRFISDMRWWAMNMVEADALGGFRYGVGSTTLTGAAKAPISAATMTHQFGGRVADVSAEMEKAVEGDTGYMYGRSQGGWISRSFDAARPQDTIELLNRMGKEDPIISELTNLAYRGDRLAKMRELGRDLTPAEDQALKLGVEQRDLATQIDNMLYSWDTKGPTTTLIDQARADLGAAETERLLPFLQKVYEKHEQTYRDVVHTFAGNPDRSTLERLANSYWLYWPISYQIKAGRWLVDVMTNRFAGAKTELAGAALYAHYYEEHKKAIASDPSYAAMYKDNATLWFLAQMMFPVTPGDLGVSLSRPVRYVGGALGIWGDYKNASDPVTAAGAIVSLGPVYTAELLARVGRESFKKPTSNLAPAGRYLGH